MFRYIMRRLLWMIPVLFFISVITFSLAHAVPGGPFEREHRLPPEIIANLNKYYSLDQPLWKQYTLYMGKYFITSISNRDYPVVMGTILLYAVVLVLANLAVDITYAFLDPRIRYT